MASQYFVTNEGGLGKPFFYSHHEDKQSAHRNIAVVFLFSENIHYKPPKRRCSQFGNVIYHYMLNTCHHLAVKLPLCEDMPYTTTIF